MDRSPSIAAIGVIGRNNNPLHISLFPATSTSSPEAFVSEPRDVMEYQLMLNSTLDIFEARLPSKSAGSADFGLLHALDERIALYGWLLNTGVKLVIVVDMEGRTAPDAEAARTAVLGLRTGDLLPAFQALQAAYIRLLRNPFYVPDDHDRKLTKLRGSLEIQSPSFIKEVERIGQSWYPGYLSA
ncbi:unnamed protein product [Zymoseptoria tritici ST99CH_3D7]|uniref:Sedlin n=2 Tax=Zymoseptoria tritici TaxID=1047171 RepID=F9XNF7_ZYMTI|nr:uncharacterized protein MYCGRDRAFT_77273 [Zymoseptoria tritici IPO323]EGP82862.1 hypothetical protein MYCGRDRAFT_77273 [Zymoseptoria tritici IPO323]SMQ55621.1 unnamed protein product [Zymoseptoria tritici ST99CH_3D7]